MLDQLNPRERMFVFALIALVALGAIFVMGMKIADMRSQITNDVALAREETVRMARLRDAISAMPSPQSLPDMNQFISQTQSVMEGLKLNAADIRNRQESTSRKEDLLIVELTFNGVSLKDIVKLMHEVEYAGKVHAKVGSLVFRKPLPNREIYDVKVTLEIIKPKTQPAAGTQ
ncbi:MAG: hypothetical protein HY042_11545 [Spirochaetia bacterium]|nr:hypothetical protein [Spirochaetia bacterium]